MDAYKLFLLFLMMILAHAQDVLASSSSSLSVGSSSLAGVITTTKAVVGSLGSEVYTMVETITSTSSPTVVAIAALSHSTATNVITINVTATAIHTNAVSSLLVTGLCYVSNQDALTPCTTGILATSSASATSPAIRNRPNGLFKALVSLKRHVVVANHNQKRSTNCNGWQAAIIITSLVIAFTLVSILFFATFLKEKREDYPRLFAYKWLVYGAQSLFVGLLIWLIVWAAIKTVGNSCN